MPDEAEQPYDARGEMAYEEIVEALETVLTELEDGGLPLDRAVEAYERGVQLSQQAQRLLTEAELRIAMLRDEPSTG